MRQSRLFMLKNWLICLPLIFFAAKVAAAEVSEPLLDSAKEAYAHGKFDAAAHYYERIVNKGYEGPELFFNLGNAYFKSNNLAMAIDQICCSTFFRKAMDRDVIAHLMAFSSFVCLVYSFAKLFRKAVGIYFRLTLCTAAPPRFAGYQLEPFIDF